jgi:thiol-disulfide isomerase/thioredoxin
MKKSLISGLLTLAIICCIVYCCCKKSFKIKYYFVPGCGHCQKFMPVWNEFSSQSSVDCEKIDCSTNPNLCSGIRGVPHIVVSNNGSDIVYQGERSVNGINTFLKKLDK